MLCEKKTAEKKFQTKRKPMAEQPKTEDFDSDDDEDFVPELNGGYYSLPFGYPFLMHTIPANEEDEVGEEEKSNDTETKKRKRTDEE